LNKRRRSYFSAFHSKGKNAGFEQYDSTLFEGLPLYLHKGYHCAGNIKLLFHIRYQHEFVRVFDVTLSTGIYYTVNVRVEISLKYLFDLSRNLRAIS